MNFASNLLLAAIVSAVPWPAQTRGQDPDDDPASALSATNLVARLVDEKGDPLRDCCVCYFLCTDGENANPGRNGPLTSDSAGRIELALRVSELSNDPKYLRLCYSDPRRPDGARDVELYLPDGPYSRTVDLGDVPIAPRGSPQRFAKLDDGQLRAEYERLLRLGSGRTEMFELLLCEFVRRGGRDFAKYVDALLERSRCLRTEGSTGPECEDGFLALLTAARRLHGKPDPLSIAAQTDGPLDLSANGSMEITLVWRNVDPLEPIMVNPRDSDLCRNGRISLDAIGTAGEALPRPQGVGPGMDLMMGVSVGGPLAPGQEVKEGLHISHYVGQLTPGEYRMRVRYHDSGWIVAMKDFGGFIVSSSPEFTVRVRAP